MKVRQIEKVLLHNEGAPEKLDIEQVARYLRGKLVKVPVEIREPFPLLSPGERLDYARKLASIKITNVNQRITSRQEPLYGEIQYEQRRILGKTKAFGILYDGFYLQRVFLKLIPEAERTPGFVHIFFTNRLFATWEEGDNRYHARTSIYSFASIISTTGLVEAPARPREYYLLKQTYEMLGKDLLELKERFKGRFIDYDDERLIDVVKGYAMQAIFYSLTGDPFCEDKGCQLCNAHWQEELIFAQLGSGYELCPRHTELLREAQASHS